MISCDGAIACDAFMRLSVAESVQRRCSHGVQLRMNVLTAAECTAEAWEAELSVYLQVSYDSGMQRLR